MIKISCEAAEVVNLISEATGRCIKDVASTIIVGAAESNMIEMITEDE